MQRTATTGLLAVCVLLAAGLAFTAALNHRAAKLAARDVLHSNAVEVSTAFISTARVTRAMGDVEKLQQLAKEMSSPSISIAVVDRRGHVQAAAGGGSAGFVRGTDISTSMVTLRDLRLQGQVHRMSDHASGAFLEHWRPLRGRGWRRGWRRGGWKRPDAPWRGGPGKRPRGGPGGVRVLRVTVAESVAEPLLGPSRTTVAMASVASVVLLVLGILMHLAARRAQATELDHHRRNALASLGEMGAVMAHEIRTPLSSIKGNAQLLGEATPDDAHIRSIVQEAERLERLVNGLLDYARPTTPRRSTCDPDQLASRAAEIVAVKAAASGVNLVSDPGDCGTCLRADPDQIIQILVNLLQNAVDSSEAGQSVVIRCRHGGGRIAFSVLDSGPGLGKTDPGQLFQPFFSTREQGTGLGLSVALQLARQHGGELELRDRKEGGVIATVIIPERGRA